MNLVDMYPMCSKKADYRNQNRLTIEIKIGSYMDNEIQDSIGSPKRTNIPSAFAGSTEKC